MKKKQEYNDIEKELDLQSFVNSVESGFKDLIDPRSHKNQDYSLMSLIIMILCAVIAGANSITAIHQYAKLKIHMFNQLIGVTNTPSYMVFWWLLTRMNPKPLQDAFIKWVSQLPTEVSSKIIAVDGKHLRGLMGDKGIHLVAAWECNKGLLLGQIKAEEKSNEITAIPELLEMMDIKGSTITIDAAGCQKKIVKKICEKGAKYMIALKGNQGILSEEAKNFFIQARAVDFAEDTHCIVSRTIEKGHGRIEEREVVVTNNLDWLSIKKEWEGLKSLVEVTSVRISKGKKSEEKRYYMSSGEWSSEEAGIVVRSHWSIENHLHWTMDVIFREDESLANTGHAGENLAMFKRMALTLIKEEIGGSTGIAAKRREAAWDDSCGVRIIGQLFRGVKSF